MLLPHVTLVSSWPEDGVPRNGVQVHTVGLARALVRAGARVTHVGFGRRDGEVEGVRLVAVPPPPAGAMTLLGPGLLAEAALSAGGDLVHVQGTWAPHGIAALRCARRAPTLVTVHGVVGAEAALRFAGVRGLLRRAVFTAAERRIAERLPVVAVSRYARARIDARRAVVVPNGVDDALFAVERRPEPGRVVCVAALEPRKDLLTLVDAVARLEAGAPGRGAERGGEPGQRVPWRLALVGPRSDPRYAAGLERRARGWGLAGRVEILGPVSSEELRSQLARAEVLALPSREESQGIALLEAMAAGVPAVASDIPGIRCWTRERGAALLVPPGDAGALASALARVHEEGALRDALVQAGAALAAEHRWARVAERTLEVYRDVLGGERAGAAAR